MNRTSQLLQKRFSSNTVKRLLLLGLVVLIVVSLITASSVSAKDEEDEEDDDDDDDNKDLSKSLGWASVGLFAVSSIFIAFDQTYRLTRRLSKEGKQGERRKTITNIYCIKKTNYFKHIKTS